MSVEKVSVFQVWVYEMGIAINVPSLEILLVCSAQALLPASLSLSQVKILSSSGDRFEPS